MYSYNWNTFIYSAAEEQRPEYHGTLQRDPVTDKPVLYYPCWKRRLWYLTSVAAMLPLLSVGVLAMALSLNLNGYIKDIHSPIYVEMLAKFAQPVSALASYYIILCV